MSKVICGYFITLQNVSFDALAAQKSVKNLSNKHQN
jgi:hypothetical protein